MSHSPIRGAVNRSPSSSPKPLKAKHVEDSSLTDDEGGEGEKLSPEEFVNNPNANAAEALFSQTSYSENVSLQQDNDNESLNEEKILSVSRAQIITLLSAFLVVVLAVFISRYFSDSIPMKCERISALKNEIKNQQEDLWQSLEINLKRTFSNEDSKPSVFLLIHNEGTDPLKLVNRIVEATRSCFSTESTVIEFGTGDWQKEDHGELVEKYIQNLRTGGVLVIAKLDEIPPQSARALHFICDTETPIYVNVAIFLTLPVSFDTESEVKNPTQLAEDKLRELWADELNESTLDPLITRVTDQVLLLKP